MLFQEKFDFSFLNHRSILHNPAKVITMSTSWERNRFCRMLLFFFAPWALARSTRQLIFFLPHQLGPLLFSTRLPRTNRLKQNTQWRAKYLTFCSATVAKVRIFEIGQSLKLISIPVSISATQHGANSLNPNAARPSGSEKFHYRLRNYFFIDGIFFLHHQLGPGHIQAVGAVLGGWNRTHNGSHQQYTYLPKNSRQWPISKIPSCVHEPRIIFWKHRSPQ